MADILQRDCGMGPQNTERRFFEWINKSGENVEQKQKSEEFFKWLTKTMEKKNMEDLVVGIFAGYPERNFVDPETYTTNKVLDADRSKIDRGEITSEEKMGLIPRGEFPAACCVSGMV